MNKAHKALPAIMAGGLYASIDLYININANTGFQFNGDVIIPNGYLFDPASHQ